MEEESLKIVKIKKCHDKVNKALLSKCYNIFWALVSSWITCHKAHDYLENGKIIDLAFALLMLYGFYYNIRQSHENTKVINENLDEEIYLEDEAFKEGLTK